jgi:hypothetical protein
MPEPRTEFEWPIYADATLAGLSVLIPIPLLDGFFEEFFRKRALASIMHHHQQTVQALVYDEVNKTSDSCLVSCLTLPFAVAIELLKSISRKLLYFLTIKRATDRLSYHWQRAFLLDYMLLVGHLASIESARSGREAMELLLRHADSPLIGLARQILISPLRIWAIVRDARRNRENTWLHHTQAQMAQVWGEFADYLQTLAAQYDKTYQELIERDTPASSANSKRVC